MNGAFWPPGACLLAKAPDASPEYRVLSGVSLCGFGTQRREQFWVSDLTERRQARASEEQGYFLGTRRGEWKVTDRRGRMGCSILTNSVSKDLEAKGSGDSWLVRNTSECHLQWPTQQACKLICFGGGSLNFQGPEQLPFARMPFPASFSLCLLSVPCQPFPPTPLLALSPPPQDMDRVVQVLYFLLVQEDRPGSPFPLLLLISLRKRGN